MRTAGRQRALPRDERRRRRARRAAKIRPKYGSTPITRTSLSDARLCCRSSSRPSPSALPSRAPPRLEAPGDGERRHQHHDHRRDRGGRRRRRRLRENHDRARAPSRASVTMLTSPLRPSTNALSTDCAGRVDEGRRVAPQVKHVGRRQVRAEQPRGHVRRRRLHDSVLHPDEQRQERAAQDVEGDDRRREADHDPARALMRQPRDDGRQRPAATPRGTDSPAPAPARRRRRRPRSRAPPRRSPAARAPPSGRGGRAESGAGPAG